MIDAIITGSEGFIGKKLVNTLHNKKLNLLPLSSKNFNILNQSDWEKLPKSVILYHLAAKSFVPESWDPKSNIFETNVLGTKYALDYCKKFNCKIIFASSYIYGIPERLPITENDNAEPNNPYALSKYFSEELAKFYCKYEGIDCTALRIFNVFGPGQSEKFLIPSIIKQVYNSSEILVNDLKPRRDYIFIDDVIEAFILAAGNMHNFNIFNIGSGKSLSVKEIIEKIQLVANKNLPIITSKNVRYNEIPDVIACIKSAKEILNWTPKYSFDNGIKEIFKNI